MSSNFKFINKLQGKKVLIFGGSSGIGFGVAEGAIEHGATVILSSSSADKLGNAVDRLKNAYSIKEGQLVTATLDASILDAIEANFENLLKQATDDGRSKIDHIVWTAGNIVQRPIFKDFTVSDIEGLQRVRVLAPSLLAKVVHNTDYVHKTANSSFTITGGMGGRRPFSGMSIASMILTSLEGLARGLAIDLAPVRVNLITAGVIQTEGMVQSTAQFPNDIQEELRQLTLTKRLGRPEDIANAYLYVMKDGFVTGSNLFSDGGRLLV